MQGMLRFAARCGLVLVAAALAACSDRPLVTGPSPSSAAVWLTTPDQSRLLAPQPGMAFGDDQHGAAAYTLDVDDETRFQEIAGFGAAVTGSAAHLMHSLKAEDRAGLIRSLFDSEAGIGLSFVRVPMGASDFSLRSYTYSDLPAGERDPGLLGFSIDPDRAEILPVLRLARAMNPALRVMASPWTAPAWMKTGGKLEGGSLRPDAFGVYAQYFRRFIEAYEAEGVPIYAVTVQNEPRHEAAYPSMRMEPGEQVSFVRDHLGPAFAAHGIGARILAWDHNWDDAEYALEVLADAGASRYIAGTAFHCYAGDVAAQSRVHQAFSSKEIFFTECSGGNWAPDFRTNLVWNLKHLVIGATRNWSRSVLLWNLALDPAGGPVNGGCSDCRGVVTVDPATGRVQRNVEYYVLGHASKFVQPGAVRVASSDVDQAGVDNVAFLNPDGSRVLIALNSTGGPRSFRVRWRERSFVYELPGASAATFVWS
jgi:glucosylceramidase